MSSGESSCPFSPLPGEVADPPLWGKVLHFPLSRRREAIEVEYTVVDLMCDEICRGDLVDHGDDYPAELPPAIAARVLAEIGLDPVR